MSREIKFRAWVEWTEKPRFEYSKNNYPDTFWGDYNDGGNVEQYTGLTDKNGKEIYEGDIVKQYSSYIYEVKQHKSGAWTIGIDHLYGEAQNCEVVGNIHENPELLGDEK